MNRCNWPLPTLPEPPPPAYRYIVMEHSPQGVRKLIIQCNSLAIAIGDAMLWADVHSVSVGVLRRDGHEICVIAPGGMEGEL